MSFGTLFLHAPEQCRRGRPVGDHRNPDDVGLDCGTDKLHGPATGEHYGERLHPPTPTYALVESFAAHVHAGQVVLEWHTQIELGTQGFGPREFDVAAWATWPSVACPRPRRMSSPG